MRASEREIEAPAPAPARARGAHSPLQAPQELRELLLARGQLLAALGALLERQSGCVGHGHHGQGGVLQRGGALLLLLVSFRFLSTNHASLI